MQQRPVRVQSVLRGPTEASCLQQAVTDGEHAAAAGYVPVWQNWGRENDQLTLTIIYDLATAAGTDPLPAHGASPSSAPASSAQPHVQPVVAGAQPGWQQPAPSAAQQPTSWTAPTVGQPAPGWQQPTQPGWQQAQPGWQAGQAATAAQQQAWQAQRPVAPTSQQPWSGQPGAATPTWPAGPVPAPAYQPWTGQPAATVQHQTAQPQPWPAQQPPGWPAQGQQPGWPAQQQPQQPGWPAQQASGWGPAASPAPAQRPPLSTQPAQRTISNRVIGGILSIVVFVIAYLIYSALYRAL